ncbi:hypothetical protein ACWCOV_32500 [Kribbella sp. NPDC002412]
MISSARGRYRADCNCSTEGGARDSKVQAVVFQLLSFVLKGGRQNVPIPEDRRMEVDMVFEPSPDFRLAIEYDGAYWHTGREVADLNKSYRLMGTGFAHRVMRLREAPLELLDIDDVSFAKGTPPVELAQLTLLHFSHEAYRRPRVAAEVFWNIETFLKSSATRLRRERVVCPDCLSQAKYLEVLESADVPGTGRPHRFPGVWQPGRAARRRAAG